MLMEVRKEIKLMIFSIKYALIREMLNKVTFFSNIIFMILNNASFIIQWLVLYSVKDNVGGYKLNHVLILWGLASLSFGISHFVFKRSYNLSSTITNGSLDNYLLQPKNVLLSSITSDVEVSAIGDILYGLAIFFFTGVSIKIFPLYILFGITSSLILTSIAVIYGSLAFWFASSEQIADRMNSMVTGFATYPDGIFKGFIKILLYTLIPIGVAAYMPVELMTNFKLYTFLIIIGVTVFLILFSFFIFNKGLKRYSSSNLMVARF